MDSRDFRIGLGWIGLAVSRNYRFVGLAFTSRDYPFLLDRVGLGLVGHFRNIGRFQLPDWPLPNPGI